MAHRRNNYTTTTNATSTGSQIMSATAASSAHSAHILYDRSPRQFPFVASNKRYERDFEPADTLVAREVTSPEGSIRDPNGRSPSAPSSMYEKKKRSLYTSGLTTGMKENEMTSLERIRKRNSALSKLETPSRSSFNTIDSPSMPSTTLVTTPAYEDRRSPQIESSPWIPPITPTGFYLQPNASESAKSLTQSQNRRRTAFMRKLSSMSLRGRIADDIWEQASEDKENNDETQSPSTSMKNRPISRGLRRRFAKFMGNPNTDKPSSSPTNYGANAASRHRDLVSCPHSVHTRSPLLRSDTSWDTQSLGTPSTRNKFPPSPIVSDEYMEYIDPNLPRGRSPLPVVQLYRPTSRSRFVPSPLFGRFEFRSPNPSSSYERKIDVGSPSSTSSAIQSTEDMQAHNIVQSASKMSLMTPITTFCQAPAPEFTELTLMVSKTTFSQGPVARSELLTLTAPKFIFSQKPILISTKLAIMTPTTVYHQAAASEHSPIIFFAISIILPLLLTTTQALTFSLYQVGEAGSDELLTALVKGWLVGALLGFMVHTVGRGITRLPGDGLFLLAWIVGVVGWGVKLGVRKLLEGFRTGKGLCVDEGGSTRV